MLNYQKIRMNSGESYQRQRQRQRRTGGDWITKWVMGALVLNVLCVVNGSKFC